MDNNSIVLSFASKFNFNLESWAKTNVLVIRPLRIMFLKLKKLQSKQIL